MAPQGNTARRRGNAEDRHGDGFTLIELLVVVAIIAVLMCLLLPALGRARSQARIVRVHADLRQICMALDSYAMDNREQLPPARSGCGINVKYQLPVELANEKYLPPPPIDVLIPQAYFPDLFNPEHTYKYLAPGAYWYNGTFWDYPDDPTKPRAKIWVPDGYPHCDTIEGHYYASFNSEPECPVTYAVWSVGPDQQSPKFPQYGPGEIDDSKFPLPKPFWLRRAGDTGLITHFITARGHPYMSP